MDKWRSIHACWYRYTKLFVPSLNRKGLYLEALKGIICIMALCVWTYCPCQPFNAMLQLSVGLKDKTRDTSPSTAPKSSTCLPVACQSATFRVSYKRCSFHETVFVFSLKAVKSSVPYLGWEGDCFCLQRCWCDLRYCIVRAPSHLLIHVVIYTHSVFSTLLCLPPLALTCILSIALSSATVSAHEGLCVGSLSSALLSVIYALSTHIFMLLILSVFSLQRKTTRVSSGKPLVLLFYNVQRV